MDPPPTLSCSASSNDGFRRPTFQSSYRRSNGHFGTQQHDHATLRTTSLLDARVPPIGFQMAKESKQLQNNTAPNARAHLIECLDFALKILDEDILQEETTFKNQKNTMDKQ